MAWRFALLCADRRGRVYRRIVPDHACRLAILIDLTLDGRLVSDSTGLNVDTSASGNRAVDAMLRFLDTRAATAATAIRTGPVGVLDILDPDRLKRNRLVRNRTVRVDPDRVAIERKTVSMAAETGQVTDETTAAVAIIAGALNIVATQHRESLLSQCGPARALTDAGAAYLDNLMVQLAPAGQGIATQGGT